DVVTFGDYAFLGLYDSYSDPETVENIFVFDVRDKTSPVKVGEFSVNSYATNQWSFSTADIEIWNNYILISEELQQNMMVYQFEVETEIAPAVSENYFSPIIIIGLLQIFIIASYYQKRKKRNF
ncbi:MAG: hypothetical protein ACXAD7_07230, partial [Candidatus Kariarchaeaceae archaeon]